RGSVCGEIAAGQLGPRAPPRGHAHPAGVREAHPRALPPPEAELPPGGARLEQDSPTPPAHRAPPLHPPAPHHPRPPPRPRPRSTLPTVAITRSISSRLTPKYLTQPWVR